jgi:hypothetical protein
MVSSRKGLPFRWISVSATLAACLAAATPARGACPDFAEATNSPFSVGTNTDPASAAVGDFNGGGGAHHH